MELFLLLAFFLLPLLLARNNLKAGAVSADISRHAERVAKRFGRFTWSCLRSAVALIVQTVRGLIASRERRRWRW